jgi:hypothetical protein
MVRFQVLRATSVRMAVFCAVAPRSLVDSILTDISEELTASITKVISKDRLDDGGSKLVQNVCVSIARIQRDITEDSHS